MAGNPFVTFAEIPVRARYQFLLDDAEYEIATFIKGRCATEVLRSTRSRINFTSLPDA